MRLSRAHHTAYLYTPALQTPTVHRWTQGRVLFASGSPFDPITDAQGAVHHPPQANNAYIFPAVGYAAVLTKSKCIPEVGTCVRGGTGAITTSSAPRLRCLRSCFVPASFRTHYSPHKHPPV